ncbi:hypothetical protein AB0451_03495 [Streptomyces sp. NPDC052000]|uniref:hypothetical protein n=1 Tax=Streptomyces sp. NPDC052000 TaxID=3155676 RepID=UPI00344DC202
MSLLDAFGWAMDAAPYIPAAMVLGGLVGAVYAAWLSIRAAHEHRAQRAEARRDLIETAAIHHLGNRLHTHPHDAIDGDLDHHLDAYDQRIRALYPTGEQQ